ncbi:nucleoside monophosphate kinase [Legionella sp. D16C41]|uniref:nucleoside monophosphate kinase n=1 Tax=Legionella sp. D16C41 TaxID=3402688 RepID=UPI003AF4C3F6
MFFSSKLVTNPKLLSPKIILLMGGPGSGKGVLAKNLPKINHFSIGESLRGIINNPTHPKSQVFKQQMEQGKLLNDQDIIEVMQQADVLKETKPILLDGFPRTLNQWNIFKKTYGHPSAVIDLNVSEEVMQKRLAGRGRKDDQAAVINYRIADYLKNTRPMAKQILAEVNNTLSVNASKLNPTEVAEIAESFLQAKKLYLPEEPIVASTVKL